MKQLINSLIQYIVSMHSNNTDVSWMRWMGTFIILDIMIMWTVSCVETSFTMEDFPTGVIAVLVTVFTGKVGQAISDNFKKKNGATNGTA